MGGDRWVYRGEVGLEGVVVVGAGMGGVHGCERGRNWNGCRRWVVIGEGMEVGVGGCGGSRCGRWVLTGRKLGQREMEVGCGAACGVRRRLGCGSGTRLERDKRYPRD